MRPWRARKLTAGERALAYDVFGNAVDPWRVRLWSCPAVAWTTQRPFTAGGLLWPGRSLILFPPAEAVEDFVAPDAPLKLTATFVHEMTHVAQSQGGTNLLWAKIKAGDSAAAYTYALDDACAWDGFNIEQQAMIVEDAFLRSRGVKLRFAEAHYARVIPYRKPQAA